MDNERDQKGTEPSLTGTLKARENVVYRQVDDEWVLYDPVSEKMHVLNVTAGLIWNHLDGTQTFDDLVSLVHEAFDPPAPTDVARRDVRAVLEQFFSAGLMA